MAHIEEGSVNRGTITRITASGVFVEVPSLGVGMEFGPLEQLSTSTAATTFVVGDRVLVASIGAIYDNLVILGKLITPSP